MMTLQEINNPNTDMMKIFYFYYTIHRNTSKKLLSYDEFNYGFTIYVLNSLFGKQRMVSIIQYVLKQLNKNLK